MSPRTALILLTVLVFAISLSAQELADEPAVPQFDYLEVWPGYVVIPWSFKTPPLNDATAAAYRRDGIEAIHLDKNFTADELAWTDQHKFRFYVDHAAGKGYLYLREQKEIRGSRPDAKYQAGGGLLKRPKCLHDPEVVKAMEELVRKHVGEAAKHAAIYYSLDDEISTGSFVNPVETCWCEHCRRPFRKFALGLYDGSLDKLNAQWGTNFKTADEIAPAGADYAVKQAMTEPADKWNFSRWADFRQFMDQTMMDTLVRLVKLSNRLDPKRPCGFEGAQQPSAWGGYDYSRLTRAVQWIEAYDLGSNDEIIRSLAPSVVRVKTFFATADKLRDLNELWYHFVHGNRSVICWPAIGDVKAWWSEKGELRADLAHLPAAFKELQGPRLSDLLAGAEFIDDGIAVYYSQPSIRAGWVLDATSNGATWPNRSGTIDRLAGSPILARYAWLAMLEDAGLQYNFIDAAKLADGQLKFPRYKALILPGVLAMSDTEAMAIKSFARSGGRVIADYLPGIMDEHCRSRGAEGALDSLFGVRHDWSRGLFDGKHVTYVDGEKFREPLANRFLEGGPMTDGLPTVERGLSPDPTKASLAWTPPPALMNAMVIPYLVNRSAGKPAPEGADKILKCVAGGIVKAVNVTTAGSMTEVVRWKKGRRIYVCIVKNPQDQFKMRNTIFPLAEISDRPTELKFTLADGPAKVINERTGKEIAGPEFVDTWVPCEAAIYSYEAK